MTTHERAPAAPPEPPDPDRLEPDPPAEDHDEDESVVPPADPVDLPC